MNYSGFQKIHSDFDIVVCGCGTSVKDFEHYNQDFITIGVNDIGRLFTPNYLVILNQEATFHGDRWNYIKNTGAKAVFTQHNTKKDQLNIEGNRLIHINLTPSNPQMDLDNREILYHSNTSTYVAINIAYHMGAKRIGVIGVDFTPDHFYKKSGQHHLSGSIVKIQKDHQLLCDALAAKNVEIYNLSKDSIIEIPKMKLEQFVKKNV